MTSFLNIVAKDLIEKTNSDFSNITIVFPNKRASLFFNKALMELTNRPIWSPQYITISNLFSQHSEWEIADRIKLICDLYDSYCLITKSTESLDQFYSWGELMLSDFDDVDKHIADVNKVFKLIGDLHEMDGLDYLLPEQQAALQRFFKNFTKEHTTELKTRFLQLWNKFQDIYNDYHLRLEKQGIAYEGMLYRSVIEKLKSTERDSLNNNRIYVFVGFNLLNTVEQELFSYYMKNGQAKFYWDFDEYYMKDGSEAGIFIRRYLKCFPNELSNDHPTYSLFTKEKNITFVSSPTEDLQARYVSQWLNPERIAAGRRTAIVLGDESLLETVLHCLPESVKHVNITTGYPLAQTQVATLIRLTTNLYERTTLTLHAVKAILCHPLMQLLSPKAKKLYESLKGKSIYYPLIDDLSVDESLTIFFSPFKRKDDCTEMNRRLIWLVSSIAKQTAPSDALTQEALYRMFTILNRLANLSLNKWSTILYTRLLQQIIHTTSIPFHGEPIEGIQIMGILETRNLDFDHILLLSCNEGNLPAKVNDSSFIPHAVRLAYNLTTVENKVAIYAYYFHRLLQRSTDICVLYNNSTNDGHIGEMSRFMLQLIAESDMTIMRKSLQAGQETKTHSSNRVEKSNEIIDELLNRGYFSPSALGRYLRCPMSYFYRYIANINDVIERDEEEIDNVTFGNIFHRAAQLIYEPFTNRTVTHQYIEGLQKERDQITLKRIVDQAFREELFKLKDDKRVVPKLGGLQVINREMIIKFLNKLLSYDIEYTPFVILGTETAFYDEEIVHVAGHERKVSVGGTIDRLDRIKNADGTESVRVVDYKTGRYRDKLSLKSLDELFDLNVMANHAPYFLQTFLYSSIVAKKVPYPVMPTIVYVQQADRDYFSSNVYLESKPVTDISIISNQLRQHLSSLIETILNKDIPFHKTQDKKMCTNCPYSCFC